MKTASLIASLFLVSLVSGCGLGEQAFKIRKAMYDQEKFEPLEPTDFFGDRQSSRELVPNTVPVGWLREDEHLYEGKVNGAVATNFPFEVTAEVMQRGQERYEIFCSVCHGSAGFGDGMVVRRGYRVPSSFHVDRLRQADPGYFYGAIKNGFGVMPSYEDQIPVRDRWAIVAYIRALQASQHASIEDVSESERAQLLAEKH